MTNKRSAQRKPLGPPLIRVQYVRPLAAHDALVDLDDRAEEAPELVRLGPRVRLAHGLGLVARGLLHDGPRHAVLVAVLLELPALAPRLLALVP